MTVNLLIERFEMSVYYYYYYIMNALLDNKIYSAFCDVLSYVCHSVFPQDVHVLSIFMSLNCMYLNIMVAEITVIITILK